MQLISNDNAPFKICQLTDLHLDPYPFSITDQQTISMIEQLLEKEQFDLIIITGDLIWGKKYASLETTLKYLYRIFDKTKTPLAITYGNHDNEGSFSRRQIRSYESHIKYPANKHQQYLVNDQENYTLEIFDEKSKQISHVIYVWDSGAYSNNEKVGLYSPIEVEQISWFNNLPYDNQVPRTDLGFLHIPIPEYTQAQNFIRDGQIGEPIGAPEINSGLFYSLVKDNNFKAIFAGHDHDNNFVANYKGIDFVYGNISGFNTYGKIKRGYKEISLYKDRVISKNVSFDSVLNIN
ncbi:metallophosphoesterase family protein [Oenococcus sp. UCMA 16435]|nr:metallophosphoesterase family protein [Oenococcus sp. UCMA 16435]